MAIEDRTKPEIVLESPSDDGNKEYVAKWIGDPITLENKLGRLDSPRTPGTIVQPLEVKGDLYQLTIFFDDADHDLTSAEFWASLKSKGKWTVIHPQIGLIEELYLSRARWEVEPIRSVGFTTFNTNWIQGLPDGELVSIIGLEANINAFSLDAIQSSIDQFVANISLDSFEEFNALVSAVNKVVNFVKQNLRKFENLQIINPRIEALIRGITSTLESFPPDVSALAAQIAGIFEAIGLGQNNAIGSVDNFAAIVTGLGDVESDVPSPSGLNAVATAELALSLSNVEIARASVLPGITTREQAVETAGKLTDYFNDMMERLDESQTLFDDAPIEKQFISQSGSFADQYKTNLKAVEFLLSSALDLKIERRSFTKVERSTLEIAWDELGGIGEIVQLEDGLQIDENYQNFCDWNDLHGREIFILPAETEYRIFV